MQLSTIVGTMILSPDGEKFGYVKEARLTRDLAALSCLVAVDDDEEEFYLPARTVLAVKDAVIAGKARIAAATGVPAPMGRSVFSEQGEYLGIVTDMKLGEVPALTVTKDVSRDVPLPHAAVGETVIIFEKERKKRAARQEKSAPSRHSASPAPAAPDPAPTRHSERSEESRTTQSDHPARFNRYNLLGKRVKKSVFDEQGTPVALAGERVTPEMLEAARRRNRLLALTVNTLTNVL